MLRAVLILAALGAVALGAWLLVQGVRGPGIYVLVVGAAVCIGTLFERWRYRQEDSQPPQPPAHWQCTGERFEDPHSGDTIEVYFDPRNGERRYVTLGAQTPRGSSH